MSANSVTVAREMINALYMTSDMHSVIRGLARQCEVQSAAAKCQDDGTAEKWDALAVAARKLLPLANKVDNA